MFASGSGTRGYRALCDRYQRHSAHATRVNAAEVSASPSAESLTAGDSAPAIAAFDSRPMNACIDDAAPRWCGYMSSSASVTIGNTSAMPNAHSAVGSTAHGSVGVVSSRL